jgi:AcrR family transcriptional regulator
MSDARRSTLRAVRDLPGPQPLETMTASQLARRARVLDAVIEMVSEGADEEMQMKEIADRSGVALGTIYRYFSSKDHVMAAALVEWTRGLEQRLVTRRQPSGSPADQLIEIVQLALRAYQRHPTFARLLIFVANSSDPAASECYRGMGTVVFSTFDAPDLDAETRDQVLTLIGALWYHELVEWANDRRSIDEVQAALVRAVRFLLPE